MVKKSKQISLSPSVSNNLGDIANGLTVYKSTFLGSLLTVRLFNLPLHGKIVFDWVNQPYALKYWKESGKYKPFMDYYTKQQAEKQEVYLILFLNNVAVGFCKVYRAADDEIAQFIKADNNDYGIHLLAAPPKKLISVAGKDARKLSNKILLTVLEMLFINSEVSKVFAEPDINNGPAKRLAERAGFRFIKEIKMSYKQASLYCINNDDFFKQQAAQELRKPS